jgi:hypothetical protein
MEASIRRSLCARKKDRSWSRTKPETPLLAGFRYAIESGARTIKMSLAANAKFALPLRDFARPSIATINSWSRPGATCRSPIRGSRLRCPLALESISRS